MLKRQSKVVSLIIALAFCMTMVFAPMVMGAASYSGVTAPSFGTTETTGALGIIEVNIDNCIGVKTGDILTVSLPSAATIVGPANTAAGSTIAVGDTLPGAMPSVFVHVPQFIPGTTVDNPLWGAGGVANAMMGIATANNIGGALTNFDTATSGHGTNYGGALPAPMVATVAGAGSPAAKIGGTHQSVDINFGANGTAGKGVFYVYINSAKVSGASDDLVASIAGSNTAVFPIGQVTIGKVVSGSGTQATVKSVKTFGDGGGQTDVITIIETKTNSLAAGNVIKLKLPAGFAWNAANVSTNWAFSALGVPAGQIAVAAPSASDPRLLTLTLGAGYTGVAARTNTGRIDIIGGIIITDDSVAKKGDISVNVYGDNVTDQDIIVAKLADYSTTVSEDTVKDVVAGWDLTELGSFKVVENMQGSLVPGRYISLTLPEGCKWHTNVAPAVGAAALPWPNIVGAPNTIVVENEKGSAAFTAASLPVTTTSNNGRTIKLTLTSPPGGFTKSTLVFKKMQVSIRPDYKGDLNIEVGGNAGASGTVKVATVNPALTIESDGKAQIIIGAQNQSAGDILLKETVKEGIDRSQGTDVVLNLPADTRWATTPKVEVTEGDAVIDSVSKNVNALTIRFKSSSSKASTIKISDVKITTNRALPEGDLKVTISRASTALTNNSGATEFDLPDLTSTVIGQCITPAPGEGTEGAAAGQFKIDSNIYQLNGVSKVMDVAPYIKSGRTYVPVRYLAYALGVAEADVVWDEASQKVTLTKGDNVVELTIGSTTITVNGEAQTMDVAPEITNGRTMLPARYVAEGLGYVVGWDPGTRTVLISK